MKTLVVLLLITGLVGCGQPSEHSVARTNFDKLVWKYNKDGIRYAETEINRRSFIVTRSADGYIALAGPIDIVDMKDGQRYEYKPGVQPESQPEQ